MLTNDAGNAVGVGHATRDHVDTGRDVCSISKDERRHLGRFGVFVFWLLNALGLSLSISGFLVSYFLVSSIFDVSLFDIRR